MFKWLNDWAVPMALILFAVLMLAMIHTTLVMVIKWVLFGEWS